MPPLGPTRAVAAEGAGCGGEHTYNACILFQLATLELSAELMAAVDRLVAAVNELDALVDDYLKHSSGTLVGQIGTYQQVTGGRAHGRPLLVAQPSYARAQRFTAADDKVTSEATVLALMLALEVQCTVRPLEP